MSTFKIQKETQPNRCEVCHQSDCWNREELICQRCSEVNKGQNLFNDQLLILRAGNKLNGYSSYRNWIALSLSMIFGYFAPTPYCGELNFHVSWLIFVLLVSLVAKNWSSIGFGLLTMLCIALLPWVKTYFNGSYIAIEDGKPWDNEVLLHLWKVFLHSGGGLKRLKMCLEIAFWFSVPIFVIKNIAKRFFFTTMLNAAKSVK